MFIEHVEDGNIAMDTLFRLTKVGYEFGIFIWISHEFGYAVLD